MHEKSTGLIRVNVTPINRQLITDYGLPRSSLLPQASPTNPCDGSGVTNFATIKRAVAIVFVSLLVGGLFYEFAHDLRMSAFIFLVTAFAGSMFTMISVVTREG